MNERGITLIELMIVISIIVILAVAAGITIPGLVGKYNMERQIKEIYSDLMNAKNKADNRNRVHFVVLTAAGYTIYEDTDPLPDGNGTLDTAADTRLLQRPISPRYPIMWDGNVNADSSHIRFTTRGLAPLDDAQTICINPVDATLDPAYDCLVVAQTRINTGELTTPIGSGGICNADNCVAK